MRVLATAPTGRGHLATLLPLARAAADAGHVVRVVVAQRGAEQAIDAGLETVSVPTTRPELTEQFAELRGQVGQLAQYDHRAADRLYVREGFGRLQAEHLLPVMRSQVQAFRPDVILHDPFQSAASIVAMEADIPSVLAPWSMWSPLLELLDVMAAGACEAAGVDDVTSRSEVVARLLGAGRYSPIPGSFERRPDVDVGEGEVIRWRYAEPTAEHEISDRLRSALDVSGEPLVLATLGSVGSLTPLARRFVETVADAFDDLDVECVLTLGRALPADLVHRTPHNVHVLEHVDQRAMLSRAKVSISHGGIDTLLDGLVASVPQVVVPMSAGDGHWNGDRVTLLGIGRSLIGEDFTAEALAAAVMDFIVEGEAQVRLKEIGDDIATLPTADEAIERLADLAA